MVNLLDTMATTPVVAAGQHLPANTASARANDGDDSPAAKKQKTTHDAASSDPVQIPVVKEFSELLDSDVVSIQVGENTYHAHRDVVCSKSKFFDRCLKGSFAEAKKDTVELKDVEPLVLRSFLTFAYTSVFQSSEGLFTAKCYCLADRLLCESFKNAVMDQYRERICKQSVYPSASTVIHIYQNGLERSKFALYCTKHIALAMLSRRQRWLERIPGHEAYFSEPGFAYDLALEMLRQSGDSLKNPPLRDACLYHDHEEGTTCPTHTGARA